MKQIHLNIQNSILKAQEELKKRLGSHLIEYISDYKHGVYDAVLKMDKDYLNMCSKKIIEKWRNSIKQNKGDGECFYLPISRTETNDHMSHYRFYEYLRSQRGNLSYSHTIDKEMIKTEDWIMEKIRSVFDNFSLTDRQDINNYESENLYKQTYLLWEVSRSINLRFRLSSFSDLWIKQVKHCRLNEGYWQIECGRGEKEKTYHSILISLVILKLTTKPEDREFIQETVQWLLKQQSTNGEWKDNRSRTLGNINPNLFVTLLAIELIQRVKPQGSIPYINKAIRWVIEQQKDDGLWEDKALGDTFFVTAIVLEILKEFETLPGNLNNFQHLARDFMYRSKMLSFEEDMQSCKTAAILTGLATEMFLYGCLDKHNISYIHNNKEYTIGLNAASKKLIQINKIQQNRDFSTEIKKKFDQLRKLEMMLSIKKSI